MQPSARLIPGRLHVLVQLVRPEDNAWPDRPVPLLSIAQIDVPRRVPDLVFCLSKIHYTRVLIPI